MNRQKEWHVQKHGGVKVWSHWRTGEAGMCSISEDKQRRAGRKKDESNT